MNCGQCGKPAVTKYGNDIYLCVACDHTFQQTQQMEHNRNVQEINYLLEQMEARVGVHGILPRYKVSEPTIHSGPVNQHNIQIHNSVIGAINTGSIEKMNVALDNIHLNGAPDLAAGIQKLTEAVLASRELSASQKTKAVDHLAFLAEQAILPSDKRNASIGTTILEGFERTISISTGLLEIWGAIKPVILKLF
jgi:hypothetical protein